MVRSFRSNIQQCIQSLIHLVISAPWVIVLLALAAAVAGIWYTVIALEFETSRTALASSHTRYIQLKEDIEKDFGKIDYIVVVVEPPHFERGKQFVQALAPRLRADAQHFEDVIEKVDVTSLEGKKLLLLSPEELRSLRQRLEDAQDFIVDLSDNPGQVQLLTSINQEISKALVTHLTGGFLGLSTSTETTSDGEEQSLDVSFLAALFTEMEQAIAAPDSYQFRSPWERFFLKDGEVFSKEGYLTSDNDRFLFVLVDDRVTKSGFVKHAAPLRALRAHIQALHRDFPDVQVGVTGGTALNNDEMLAAQHDTILATVIALVGVAVLFIVAFRQVWRPLLVVAMLIMAVCWALGFTTLTVGHLNILSVAFAPILIGLGIDFGIHLLARYGEERARDQDFVIALQAAYRHTGPSVAAAALTTALAFYAVILADFRGLVELGFIAGSGMLLCLLASFTVLPALLVLSERHQQVPPGVWKALPRDPLQGLKRFPRTLLSTITLLTLAGVLLLPTPQFDYNLLNLQAQGTESVIWEYRLLEESDRSSWYAINVANSLDELYRKKARFAALPVVDHVASLASVMPADQAIRLPLVKELAPYVKDISGTWDQPEPIDLDELDLLLQKIRFKLQGKATDWDPKKRPSEAELTAAREALLALQERLGTTPPETARNALELFQRALMADFADKLALLQRNVDPTPITLTDVPAHLRQRFVSKSGRYLLQVFARENIWEHEPMQDFVTQLQGVDTDIIGPPVVALYSIEQMLRGYTRGGIYALLVIIGIMLLLFRRLKPTLLALLPMLLGGLWTIIGMAVLDLPLNMANMIILPLFLGIAVDDGIHLVHRMLESPEDATSPLARSTGKAIVLTSLTTMVGFGSLLVARHTGVFSLGMLATLAVGCALIATLVMIPLVLHLLPPAPSPSSEETTPATAMQDMSSRL
jgi:hopanoid biosynthesis associated RND transporter like protein HpnN